MKKEYTASFLKLNILSKYNFIIIAKHNKLSDGYARISNDFWWKLRLEFLANLDMQKITRQS